MNQSSSKNRAASRRVLAGVVIGCGTAGLLGIAVVACSDDPAPGTAPSTTPPASDAAPDSMTGDAAPVGCPLQTPSLVNGKVHHLGPSNGLVDAAGVRVCIHQRPDIPCVTTAADGTFEQSCVPEGDTAIAFSKDGYASTLWLRVVTPGIGQTMEALVVKDSENAALFATAGVTYPRAGYGLITMNDMHDSDGVVVTSLGNGTEGPFYSASGTAIERDAGATFGDGVAFMIAPVGTLKLRIAGPDGGACQQVLGGWESKDSTVTVPVLENTETSLFIACQ